MWTTAGCDRGAVSITVMTDISRMPSVWGSADLSPVCSRRFVSTGLHGGRSRPVLSAKLSSPEKIYWAGTCDLCQTASALLTCV